MHLVLTQVHPPHAVQYSQSMQCSHKSFGQSKWWRQEGIKYERIGRNIEILVRFLSLVRIAHNYVWYMVMTIWIMTEVTKDINTYIYLLLMKSFELMALQLCVRSEKTSVDSQPPLIMHSRNQAYDKQLSIVILCATFTAVLILCR